MSSRLEALSEPACLPLCCRMGALVALLATTDMDYTSVWCARQLWRHLVGYLCILGVSVILEAMISVTAMRGGILEVERRSGIKYQLYCRLGKRSAAPVRSSAGSERCWLTPSSFVFTGVMVFELVWLVLGVIWLIFHYHDCPVGLPKNIMMGECGCFHRRPLIFVEHLQSSGIFHVEYSNALTCPFQVWSSVTGSSSCAWY